MTGNSSTPESSVNTLTGLPQLRQKIVDSGVLGRSSVYINLFDYLLNCAENGKQPKEFEIAIEVLNRDSSFDVARDSIVRVYIHQLRKRLDTYFETIDPNASYRLLIPKGQYTLLSVPADKPQAVEDSIPSPIVARNRFYVPFLYALIIVLLVTNLAQWFYPQETIETNDYSEILNSPVWRAIQLDDRPILIVMGDYYIFGELDESGRVSGMIRDFMINSRQDLANLFLQNAELQLFFRDLDMTYLPEGSAFALAQIAPLIKATGKTSNITMMSRLNTADLRNNHIVYIGYISGMDKLNNLFFSASGLLPGSSFDELYNKETGVTYSSNAGLPEQGQPFKDLALLASWKAASGNQFILIGGTRDAGVMQAATIASNLDEIEDLSAHLEPTISPSSFEALYEVYGINRLNFDSSLFYKRSFNPHQVWTADQL